MKSRLIWRVATAFLVIARIDAVSTLPTATSLTTSLATNIEESATWSPVLLKTTSTNTSTTATSEKDDSLYLPVTTAAPDLLGITAVSDVYGPGAWSGWFVTLVAAWWRIFRASEDTFDPNTWAFLFGCNWAAVDILRSIHSVVTAATPMEARSKFGLYAAAFTVAFWGTLHAFCQALVTASAYKYSRSRNRRLATLFIGMVLPAIALQAAGIHAILSLNLDSGFIPALYWHGMEQGNHDKILLSAAWAPIFGLLPTLIYFINRDDSFAPSLTAIIRTCFSTIETFLRNTAVKSLHKIFTGVSWCLSVVSVVLIIWTNHIYYAYLMIPLTLTIVPAFVAYMPILVPVNVFSFCVGYVFKGYFHQGFNVSDSCFFMPCAPQSLGDSNQLYHLFFSILSFVGFDVVPIVYKDARNRFKSWQDNRALMEETADRIKEHELTRISTSGVKRTNMPGAVVRDMKI